MFYKSYRKCEARAFDHLYDPIYTAGNIRDIQRENGIALTKTAPVNIYTNFDSMFSDLPQNPRSSIVLQRNQLPRAPDLMTNDSHQSNGNHYASGRNRAKFFNIPLANERMTTKSAAHVKLIAPAANATADDDSKMIVDKTPTKPQAKTRRSVSCQTIFREQSAQTKPYLPQIRYHAGVEQTELFQCTTELDTDSPPIKIDDIKAINRRRKRLECERILKQCDDNTIDEQRLVLETLEWEEWLTRENDIENTQLIRFRSVQEMLKQRDKLFEMDSIKTIDHSVNRLNNKHKSNIENINKKYERSIRKLRKLVYNQTKCSNGNADLGDAVQKVRHGNLNNSVMVVAGNRKYETALSRIETVGNFTVDYDKAARNANTAIDKPKKAICEIAPGFLKDNNLRIVYEALKAYRLQQTIHAEISNNLKSIDALRLVTTTNNVDESASKIGAHKSKIAELLKILSHLKELLQNIQHISIDSFVDLLTHKFNVILTECTVNELLNAESLKVSPFASDFIESSTRQDFSSVYLNDILRRCNEMKGETWDDTNDEGNEIVVNDEVVRDIVWPEVMHRLDDYLDHRMKIKVDLKHITSEEETAMVESVGNECVESIMDELFKNKTNNN